MLKIRMTRASVSIPDILLWPFPLFLRAQTKSGGLAGLLEAINEQPEEKEERLIHCRTCGKPITSSTYGIAVNGRHLHIFPNPLGIVFEIGCFSLASGCMHRGLPTGEFSWFPGFSWCFALCAGCNSHLGWNYSSAETNFYGLITANLLTKG
jgi:hypothetical protein